MTRKRFAIGVIGGVLGVMLICELFNPLRRSNWEIAAGLLERTPPGTPREEIRALIVRERWSVGGIVPEEQQALSGELGGYQGFPFYVFVYARWEFDENGRLRAIQVTKLTDAL